MGARTPEGLVAIADVAGWDAALTLVRHVGGQSRRIPHESNEEHWLHVLVGPEAAGKICRHFGGDVLTVPRNVAEVLDQRNQKIRAERESGATVRKLAEAWHMTERQIYNVLRTVEG